MKYYAYVLRSRNTRRLYKGSCEDIDVRLARHNSGKVRSAKPYLPWDLIYSEEFSSRSEAYQKEQYWKTVRGAKDLKFILDRYVLDSSIP